jgi:hypothetical protein
VIAMRVDTILGVQCSGMRRRRLGWRLSTMGELA